MWNGNRADSNGKSETIYVISKLDSLAGMYEYFFKCIGTCFPLTRTVEI